MCNLINRIRLFFTGLIPTLERVFLQLSRPTRYSLVLSIAADLPRSKTQLIAMNALLHQQWITLRVQRHSKLPCFTQSDRLWLVFIASGIKHWKAVLLILKPVY